MAEVLRVEQRSALGSRNSHKLRLSGRVPAVLYGHGKDSVHLSVPADEFRKSLKHGTKVVDLEGAADGQALLKDVQWDTFFKHVLHVDLLRVVAGEKILVVVPIELRGESPGSRAGGVIQQPIRDLEIEVSPANVPERLHLSLNSLELEGTLTVADIEDVPEGATLTMDPTAVIVQCNIPMEAPEAEEEVAGEGAEPEVIGEKSGEEGEEEKE